MPATVHFDAINRIFEKAHADGRTSLYEHEAYDLLAATGAEAAPVHRLIPVDRRPHQGDLDAVPGKRVVLKVVSPDITHKTEAHGIRIVAREIGAVEAAFELMLREVPEVYARYLQEHEAHRPEALRGLRGMELENTLRERMVGILLCQFIPSDAQGFATELFVGLRNSLEFGPIISAGLGGVEMEILARETRPGAAVAISPTGLVDGLEFFGLFKNTLSYERLSGRMRGARRQVADQTLVECFQAFIDLANHFSEVNPGASFHLGEFEVNPFLVSGGHLAPVDGVCSFGPPRVARPARPIVKIDRLLRPASVAVIGASAKSMNMGRIILNNIVKAGFPPEKAFVIRQDVNELDGVRCVPSISEIPEKVDLLLVAVAAHQVPSVLEEVFDHDKANAVILIPGGLGEKEGSQELARRLKERIDAAHGQSDGGPVIIGGNSLGVISHPGRYDTMFIPEIKLPKSKGRHRRNLAFISQSGAFIIANLSQAPWLDPAYALSIGNQIDLTAGDLLLHMADDPQIEVIATYMEGFRKTDGLAFARAVRRAVVQGKDVVFYKAGRTVEGRSATAGHTASVAGDYAVCEAALREAGAFVASTFDEFSDFLELCSHLRDKKVLGNGLAAMSNAGFESVGMADSIRGERCALKLARFAPETERRLRDLLAENRLDGLVDVKNPFDVTPMATDAAFANLVDVILQDPGTDVMATGIVPLTPAMQTLPAGDRWTESLDDPRSIAQLLPAVAAKSSKPLVAVIDSGALYDPMAKVLGESGLPVFRRADRAVRSLRRWTDVRLRQQAQSQEVPA